MQKYAGLEHPFEPVFDKRSRVLILGTFPSVKSRERGFYYGHPQNRFWKVIAKITDTNPVPETIAAKKQMLFDNGIALSDVLQSCDIEGSSDASIKNAVPMDLSEILNAANVDLICANGDKARRLFVRYFGGKVNLKAIKLPSTSPANAKYNLDALVSEWRKIFDRKS
ncbi:MAG: DNA-deoxyinosine glycosylase [Holosporaceae bacterium]|jgi:hypoxanthine-DNA glycosylase|nr:DNA-deoxyinosine glycosylase [Holosporaceae bacterium]